MAAKSGGKRAGVRRGARPQRRLRPKILAYALAITVLVVGWGYLVWLAIDFGGDARSGDSGAWTLAAVSAVGAAACLFAGLMLAARLSRTLGLASVPAPRTAPGDTSTAGLHVGSIDGSTVVGPGGPPPRTHVADQTNPYGPPALHPPEQQGHASEQPRTPGGSHRHRAG